MRIARFVPPSDEAINWSTAQKKPPDKKKQLEETRQRERLEVDPYDMS